MTPLRWQLFVVLVATLILTTAATGQVIIARANPAAAGQQAIFKVIGGASPVCLDLFQLADSGALLTMSSYYVGPLQTVQVTVPPVAHFKTTATFALSDPTVNAQPAATVSQLHSSPILRDRLKFMRLSPAAVPILSSPSTRLLTPWRLQT